MKTFAKSKSGAFTLIELRAAMTITTVLVLVIVALTSRGVDTVSYTHLDTKINPDYLRNVQFHQILSLILVLIEMEMFGEQYSCLLYTSRCV